MGLLCRLRCINTRTIKALKNIPPRFRKKVAVVLHWEPERAFDQKQLSGMVRIQKMRRDEEMIRDNSVVHPVADPHHAHLKNTETRLFIKEATKTGGLKDRVTMVAELTEERRALEAAELDSNPSSDHEMRILDQIVEKDQFNMNNQYVFSAQADWEQEGLPAEWIVLDRSGAHETNLVPHHVIGQAAKKEDEVARKETDSESQSSSEKTEKSEEALGQRNDVNGVFTEDHTVVAYDAVSLRKKGKAPDGVRTLNKNSTMAKTKPVASAERAEPLPRDFHARVPVKKTHTGEPKSEPKSMEAEWAYIRAASLVPKRKSHYR